MSANDQIRDFNVERRERSESERRFILGAYTFKRRPSIPLHVITGFANLRDVDPAAPDTPEVLRQFEDTFSTLVESKCRVTATGAEVDAAEAWRVLTTEGDELDVVGAEDLANITNWLVAGAIDRPTGQPSDSPDGSQSQNGGTNSMDTSHSAAPASTLLTPVAPVTPLTPPS